MDLGLIITTTDKQKMIMISYYYSYVLNLSLVRIKIHYSRILCSQTIAFYSIVNSDSFEY